MSAPRIGSPVRVTLGVHAGRTGKVLAMVAIPGLTMFDVRLARGMVRVFTAEAIECLAC